MVRLRNILLSASLFLNIMLVFLWAFESGIQQLPAWIKVAGRLHPMVLHFPITLLLLIAFLEIVRARSPESNLGIDLLLSITAFTAVVSALFGFFLLHGGGYESSDDLQWHKIAGILTSLIAGLLSWLRGFKRIIYLPALMAGCLLLVITGHLGSSVTHGKDFITEPLMAGSKKIKNIDEAVVYEDMIQPIFNDKCIGCHNPNKRKGGLLLIDYKELGKGGENGAVLTAGNADSSDLYNFLLLPPNDDMHMPPEGKPQPDAAEIALIKWWIQTGADPKKKFKDAVAPDSIVKIVRTKYDAGSPLDQLNIAFADADVIKKLDNNDRSVRQLSIEKPYINVFMANRKKIDDKELEELLPISDQITSIDLSYSNLTYNQAQKIAAFPHLQHLFLENSNVNDSAINALSKLQYLEYLNLSNTNVTEAVFRQAANFKSLKKFFVYETDIPAERVIAFQKSRPRMLVGYTPDLTKDTAYRGRLTDPEVLVDSNMFINYARVKMSYRLKGVNIHYTTDGTEPDSSSAIYHDSLVVNKTGLVKVKALRAGWQPSKTLTYRFEKANHKFIAAKLASQPDKRYPAKLDSTLIDFKRGPVDASDENYMGFEGSDMVAWLNLGQPTFLSSLSLSYLTNHGSMVIAPLAFEVWTASADGRKQNRIASVSNHESGFKKETLRKILTARFPKQSLQYLIVRVVNPGKLPSWHPSKGNKSWIFVDEVIAD